MSIMRRSIQPAAFIDALTAVQASQLKERGPNRKEVLDFLRKYEKKRHEAVDKNERHCSLATAVSLCQLYRSSQYFIKDLASRSNFYLGRCGDTAFFQTRWLPRGFFVVQENGPESLWGRLKGELCVDRDDQYALSDVEEGRLQRAFYRYELYTQVFSSGMEHSGERLWELPSDSHFFLSRYQHWELEELACINNYLWSLLSSSFDRIEPAFVGLKLPEPPLDASATSGLSFKRSKALREAKYKIHSLYADQLLTLSLSFLHHALRLERLDMQREMSSHICYHGQKHSLLAAMEGFWNRVVTSRDSNLIHRYIHAIADDDCFLFEDAIDRPNEGWLCVYGNTYFVSPYGIRHATQSLGYVFWDSQRLRNADFGGPLSVEKVRLVFQS